MPHIVITMDKKEFDALRIKKGTRQTWKQFLIEPKLKKIHKKS